MSISIDKQTLILRKLGKIKAFLVKPKHEYDSPNEDNKFIVPIQEKKGDYYENPCLS